MKPVVSSPSDDTDLNVVIEGILDDADRMFLATSVDGISSGASVFYARDGYDLLFFTFNPSRKAEQIRINPTVQAVIWPKAHDGIRGLQIEGECHLIRNPEQQSLAHDKILSVTDAFRSYMDDRKIKNAMTTLGPGVYRCKDRTFASYKPEDEAKVFAWLREQRVGSIIKEAIHPSTLSSTIGELIDNKVVIPDFITTYTEWTPGIRGNGYEAPALPAPVEQD